MTDAQGRPRLLMLSAGNVNDMTMAGALIGQASGRFDRLNETAYATAFALKVAGKA